MNKKNFTSGIVRDLTLDVPSVSGQSSISPIKILPAVTVVKFPKHTHSSRKFDFSIYYRTGFDEIVIRTQEVIEHLVNESVSTRGASLSIATIQGYCDGGLVYFFQFCKIVASSIKRELYFNDIGREFIEHFIVYLSQSGLKSTSQKNAYSKVKALLMIIGRQDLMGADYFNYFPRNPYPGNHRKAKGESPLSTQDISTLTRCLKKELDRISKDTGEINSYDLTICILAIAIRTGINKTPLLELQADCIQPHPLKHDRRLLISFKRRGKSFHFSALRKTQDIAALHTVMLDTISIVEMIVARNERARVKSNTNRLFAYTVSKLKPKTNSRLRSSSKATFISSSTLERLTTEVIERCNLIDAEGKYLVVNIGKLRKTFINRIWSLSGQDAILTAAMGGHSIKVSNDHYLEAPPEAERNFNLLGEIRVKELLGDEGSDGTERTPIAQCEDPRYGHRAPKNGNYCTSFLSCFQCKSFVVTENDLYRIFSLYWLLIKQRSIVGAKRWGRYYANIVKIIDNEIAPKFSSKKISEIRKYAHDSPHPYWRNIDLLELEDS